MYMIEITENKFDSLAEHVAKSLHCMKKAFECIEELREGYDEEGYDNEDENDYDYERYGNRNMRQASSYKNKRSTLGRYSRY